jgi:hypothetical protein
LADPLCVEQDRVRVQAEANRIILEFPHLQAVLEMWRPLGTPEKRRISLGHIQETLEHMGVNVEVRVQGRSLGAFGPGADRGLLQRIVGA